MADSYYLYEPGKPSPTPPDVKRCLEPWETTAALAKPKVAKMALVKVRDRAQITLPPEARQALNVAPGDYLEAEVVEGGVLLKPVDVFERKEARDKILRIVNRPKWRGSEPGPSEEEIMEMVVDELRRMRKEHEGRSR